MFLLSKTIAWFKVVISSFSLILFFILLVSSFNIFRIRKVILQINNWHYTFFQKKCLLCYWIINKSMKRKPQRKMYVSTNNLSLCTHFLVDNFRVSITCCQIRLSYDPFQDSTNPTWKDIIVLYSYIIISLLYKSLFSNN